MSSPGQALYSPDQTVRFSYNINKQAEGNTFYQEIIWFDSPDILL